MKEEKPETIVRYCIAYSDEGELLLVDGFWVYDSIQKTEEVLTSIKGNKKTMRILSSRFGEKALKTICVAQIECWHHGQPVSGHARPLGKVDVKG